MTDDDVVKYVIEDNFMAWFEHPGGVALDYEPKKEDDRSRWRNYAAYLNMYQTWHEPWREHLDNALEVVRTWRAR